MEKITIKTDSEIEIMKAGGQKLARIKKEIAKMIRPGTKASEIEDLTNRLIIKEGGEASFKKVQGYKWATCINVNSGLVHGIPGPKVIFKEGDLVSVDLGIFFKGFHTDTSISLAVGKRPQAVKTMLAVGRAALKKAIFNAKAGNRIYDISKAIEETVTLGGFTPIRALVGHGVGKALHEEPQIFCFTFGVYEKSPKIVPGMVLAIEVMYTSGSPEIVTEKDGWTISTQDGKISALFEETVAVTSHGPLVLTA